MFGLIVGSGRLTGSGVLPEDDIVANRKWKLNKESI